MAAIDLVKKCGGSVVESCFVANLPDLRGSKKLETTGIPYYFLMNLQENKQRRNAPRPGFNALFGMIQLLRGTHLVRHLFAENLFSAKQ